MALLIAGGHRGEGGRGDRNKLEELQEVFRVLVVNSKGWLENELDNNSLKSTLEKNKTSDCHCFSLAAPAAMYVPNMNPDCLSGLWQTCFLTSQGSKLLLGCFVTKNVPNKYTYKGA